MKEKTIYPVRSDYENDEDFFRALVEYGQNNPKPTKQYISVGLDIDDYEKLKEKLKENGEKLSDVIRNAVKMYILPKELYRKSFNPEALRNS